jgi:hypothetical protein
MVVNMSRCHPPLEDEELRSIANSVMTYAVGDTPIDALPAHTCRAADWVPGTTRCYVMKESVR